MWVEKKSLGDLINKGNLIRDTLLLLNINMKAYTYILKCSDGSLYTGSTKYLDKRIKQHKSGEGANYTKNKLPLELVYFEEFDRIDNAFYREKQIQKWSKKKKIALIEGRLGNLKKLSKKTFKK